MNGKWIMKLVPAAVAVVALAACGTPHRTAHMADMDAQRAQLEAREAELSSMQSQMAARENQLTQQQAQLEQQMREARTMSAQTQPAAMSGEGLLPPNAKPGECYARVFVPPKYSTVSQTVLKQDAGQRVEIIPAKYETVKEQVLAKEASQKLEMIPAQYDWVEEQVMVKPATKRLVQVPAQYETVTEKVLVKPAHTVWKKGTGPIQRIDEATGEIMCLVEVPAQYKTVSKQVLKAPAATREIEEPAVFKTVKKQVMVKAPTTRVVEIPAEYRTVTVTKMVQPAQERRIDIPAEYQTVTKQVLEAEGNMEWREILCKTNMTPGMISNIQQALQKAGYSPGPIDGVVGSQTMMAVNSFQRDKGLVVTDNLTMNTIRALGVNP